MKSLIIVGLPRSMSSLIYRYSCYMLEDELNILDKNIWHDGDILNHIQIEFPKIKKKFARHNYTDYLKSEAVLKKYSKDYLIKSVPQPKHLVRFLNENKSYNVLLVRRELADTIYSLYLKEWFWTINILGLDSENKANQTLENLCKSVIKIQNELLENIEEKELISYENLLFDETLLYRKLKKLGYDAKFISHIDEDFKKKRETVLSIRKTPLYKEISKLIGEK